MSDHPPASAVPPESRTAAEVRLTVEERLRAAINAACGIIEEGDRRLLADDGPCGGQPPRLTLAEWRALYVVLDDARAV